MFNLSELIDQLADARAEARIKGLIAQQAETAAEGERESRAALELELHEARARVQALEAETNRPRWFKLSYADARRFQGASSCQRRVNV